MARTGGFAIGLAAVLAMAACTSAAPPRDPVPTHTKAEVEAEVKKQAEEIAKLVGQPLQNPKVSPANCLYKKKANDGSVIVVQGTYHIALPTAEHDAAGARVRDAWKAAGYKITTDTATPGKGVEMAATTPAQYTARLSSSTPPTAFLVLIQSPCFHEASGA